MKSSEWNLPESLISHDVKCEKCLPIVMMSVKTFRARTLTARQPEARIAPAIVTDRQPYLLTKEDEIGPLA